MSAPSASDCCARVGCGHPAEAHTEEAIFPPCEGTAWPPKSMASTADFWATHKNIPEVCPCERYEAPA